MELRTKSFWVRSFLLTISIAWLYVFIISCPGEAFAESKGGSLPDFDLTSPELLAAKQEAADATAYNRPGEKNKRLNGLVVQTNRSIIFPIIFLPGVAGTRLYFNKEEIWPAPLHQRDGIKKLFMDKYCDL